MTQRIKTFLMFDGRCEEAMTFYVSLFKGASITSIRRYGAEGPGAEGSVASAAARRAPPRQRTRRLRPTRIADRQARASMLFRSC